MRGKHVVANCSDITLTPSSPSSFIRVTRNQLHITRQPSPSTAVATLPYRPSWPPEDWLVPAVHAAPLPACGVLLLLENMHAETM